MPKKKDLSGMRFGKLVSVREVGMKNGAYVWECVCDCGNTAFVDVPAGIHRAVVAIDEKERKSRPIHTGFAERDCTEFGAI